MSRLTLALTLAIFTFIVTAAYATVDSTPPADWDYGSHDVDETDPQYEIVWTGQLDSGFQLLPDPKTVTLLGGNIGQLPMCIGIMKYDTHLDESEGEAFAFFATRAENTTLDDLNADPLECDNLVASEISPRRPAFVFLHEK
ncbi:hypothetical protein K8I61_10585 [bacterium]|nr:hypothetical protein [bacterium]